MAVTEGAATILSFCLSNTDLEPDPPAMASTPNLWRLLKDGSVKWCPDFRFPSSSTRQAVELPQVSRDSVQLFADSSRQHESKPPCYLFRKPGGCKWGDQCSFSHLTTESKDNYENEQSHEAESSSVTATHLDDETLSTQSCPPFQPFNYIELFAGIGGFRLALDRLGGKCVYANEYQPTTCQVYADNFGHVPDNRDIRDVPVEDIPPHCLLTGGFPCQPFSTIGKQGGFDDVKQGDLFWQIVRIAQHHRPRALLLENVPGLVNIAHGAVLRTILAHLSALGYRLAYKVVDASLLVPQYRKRIYIVGIRHEALTQDPEQAAAQFQFPRIPNLQRVLVEALQPLGEIKEDLTIPPSLWDYILQSRYFAAFPHHKVSFAFTYRLSRISLGLSVYIFQYIKSLLLPFSKFFLFYLQFFLPLCLLSLFLTLTLSLR